MTVLCKPINVPCNKSKMKQCKARKWKGLMNRNGEVCSKWSEKYLVRRAEERWRISEVVSRQITCLWPHYSSRQALTKTRIYDQSTRCTFWYTSSILGTFSFSYSVPAYSPIVVVSERFESFELWTVFVTHLRATTNSIKRSLLVKRIECETCTETSILKINTYF